MIFLALSDSKSNTIILVIAMSDILRSERNQLVFSGIKHPAKEVSNKINANAKAIIFTVVFMFFMK